MILINKVRLINFLSHSYSEIVFSKNEKMIIDGASGAGKSSILDAIVWVLYGQGRVLNGSLIKNGAKKCVVSLELSKESNGVEQIFVVEREVTVRGKHLLNIYSQKKDLTRVALPVSGIRECQEFIDKDLIGASWLLFINSVVYLQNKEESFVSQTSQKRKELLLEIAKTDNYKKYYEKSRSLLSTTENSLLLLEAEEKTNKSSLETIRSLTGDKKLTLERISSDTEALNKIEEENPELEKKIGDLKKKEQSFIYIDENITSCKKDLSFTKEILAENKKELSMKEELEKSLTEITKKLEEIPTKEKEVSDAKKRLEVVLEQNKKRSYLMSERPVFIDRTANNESLGKEIQRILEKPTCPSGDACPYSGDNPQIIKNLQERISENTSLMEKAREQMTAWEESVEALPVEENIGELSLDISNKESSLRNLLEEKNKESSIKTSLEKMLDIEKKIPLIENTLEEKEKKLADLLKEKEETERDLSSNELPKLEIKLRENLALRDQLKKDISVDTAALISIELHEKEMVGIEKKINGILEGKKKTEITLSRLAIIKKAFSPRGGIETLVIDHLLSNLEEKINNILSKLSEFRVKLDTQRVSTDGETLIEGLFITIINEKNEELPFESYSGGEKLKISVAISEALATLQQVGFRLFDETIFALDENALESFTGVLEELLTSFPQIIMISHIQEIKELFPRRIKVLKNNETSSVEIA